MNEASHLIILAYIIAFYQKILLYWLVSLGLWLMNMSEFICNEVVINKAFYHIKVKCMLLSRVLLTHFVSGISSLT